MIYSAGNFIECTTDTPYLQIGEHKYGKPVLDRAISYDIDLYDALKIGLISMDSTMRSNLGVGLPIDLLVVRRDACDAELNYRIEPGEPYFQDLRERWSAALARRPYRDPAPALSEIRRELSKANFSSGYASGVALHLPSVNRTARIASSPGNRPHCSKTKANSKLCPLASAPQKPMGRTL